MFKAVSLLRSPSTLYLATSERIFDNCSSVIGGTAEGRLANDVLTVHGIAATFVRRRIGVVAVVTATAIDIEHVALVVIIVREVPVVRHEGSMFGVQQLRQGFTQG